MAGAIDEIRFTFSEPVNGFDPGDLTLTRSIDQIVSLVPAEASLTTLDDTDWTLGGVGPQTSPSGIYELILSGTESNITDLAGNRLSASAVTRWTNRPGDANEDERFDRLDVDQVVQLGRYNTDQAASWRSGDWSGNGLFDQFDIIKALQTGQYRTPPFGVSQPIGPPPEDRFVSVRLDNDSQTARLPTADDDLGNLDSLFGQLGEGP